MGKLVLHLPGGATRDIALARERMTIGRRADNDICVPLPTVSAEHAAVVTVLDDSFLEDLGSHNGTLVNGRPVRKHLLRDGDEIDIGRQRLVYRSGDPPDDAGDARAVVVEAASTAASSVEGRSRHVRAAHGGAEPVMIDTSTLFDPPPAARAPVEPPASAATLEVLDGASAGRVVAIDRAEYVLGRVGVQLAAIRATGDGMRLVLLEGESPPAINGASLPQDGALLAQGDEIVVAGTRLAYRCAVMSANRGGGNA